MWPRWKKKKKGSCKKEVQDKIIPLVNYKSTGPIRHLPGNRILRYPHSGFLQSVWTLVIPCDIVLGRQRRQAIKLLWYQKPRYYYTFFECPSNTIEKKQKKKPKTKTTSKQLIRKKTWKQFSTIEGQEVNITK